ncbi:MAG: heme ABC transporter ATP-binding protein [Firmicutes bacterium]|nr:heme ABC transporter ATP-binding protein [Bacillota bacterium]
MAKQLVVGNLSFGYDIRPIMQDISFTVSSGEMLGIIGPNGSGKTTLLKLISQLLVPDEGRVLIDGEDTSLWSHRTLARTMAVVPQETQIRFDFTVEEIVEMGRSPYLGRFQAMTKHDREIVVEAMRATSVLPLAKRSIMELSGGERQRVIVARALAQEPQVLLLDEPTASLDINHEVEIFELLRTLTIQEGLVSIAVLHDLNLAAEYCDRLLLLSQGRVAAEGFAEEVLTEEIISSVYGIDVVVYKNLVTGRPQIQALAPSLNR